MSPLGYLFEKFVNIRNKWFRGAPSFMKLKTLPHAKPACGDAASGTMRVTGTQEQLRLLRSDAFTTLEQGPSATGIHERIGGIPRQPHNQFAIAAATRTN